MGAHHVAVLVDDIRASYETLSAEGLREALRQLVNEGLVTYEPNVGARVAQLELAELEEIYHLRELLEPYAIARSAPNLTNEDLDRLRDYVEQMEDAWTAERCGLMDRAR